MYAVERLSSYITQGVYTVSGPFHPFGGAVDIIVVQQQDGSFKSSPWYVRFGKFQGMLKTKEKVVNIRVNGVDAGFHMFLDHKGEAYFLEESDAGDGEFVTSPASSGDETDQKSANARFEKIQSCDYDDSGRRESVSPSEVGNGKIVARTRSKRARILGLMFGRRSMKGDEQSGNVERVSSLERAEIAADLLEMKWSTNLSGNNHRHDKTVEQLSDINGADPVNASKEGSPLKPSLHDEVVNYHGEGLDDNFQTRIISTEYVEEITICSSPHLGLSEELLTDEMRAETDEFDVASSESIFNRDANEFHGEGRSDRLEGSTSSEENIEETTSHGPCLRHEEVVEIYTSETIELGNKSEVVSDIVPVEIDETDITSRRDILKNSTFDSQSLCSGLLSHDTQQALDTRFGDFGEEEVNSFSYCETLESTAVRLDVSSDEAHDTLHSRQGEHFEPYVEVLNERVELTSEVKLQPESGARAGVENPIECHHQSLELSTAENCSAFENPQAGCLSNEASEETTAFSFSTDSSHVAVAVQAVIGFASEHQVTDKDTVTEELVQEKETSTKQMKSPGHQSQVNVGSIKAEKTCALLSESLEDDQLQFSENDGFVCKGVPMGLPDDNASVDTEDHPLSNPEDDLEEHESKDEDHKQSFGGFPDVSTTKTCPISIPKGKAHLVGSDLSIRSLPNIRSHINDLERSNLQQPLSCSLNSESEIYNKDVVKNSYTGSSNLEASSGNNMLQDQLASSIAAKASNAEEKVTLFNPAVELSLCKHLLYQGMGSDAARQAFDAEKVNMEKFSALGPSLVRNDKLVVRIGGRYFPWVAAAPIILGMVAFGQEHIFEPQGMIAVDRDDKNLNGDTSRAMVPSGGSWRLWPFGFKKSNTMSTVRSTPEGTDGKTADPKLIGDRDRQRASKKKVLTPTSDQLASLNLKEGRNVVTFSFSTAMLGQQQVDARIYLWKWNTRIVISDVDGTITKSDVLGQFMPLVGVDWSQTGVAPLFSAIKDNGYQLLFLSARAISQAYLTRQFLFNLKQDGKALPDGPVVISPDGLFPSLYREVIRRAPHEFKISCLEDIRALFPPDCNPFYAGFGNRDTDEVSYLKVGIPKGKIFIINPKGEVAVNRRVDTKSYTSLRELVNGMFPARSSAEQEEFNNWNFWKVPLLDLDI